MEVDEALTTLGRYSKWQMAKYVLLSASVTVPGAWHMLVYVFIAAEPPHHCHVPTNTSRESYIPQEMQDGKSDWAKCTRYSNLTENSTVLCDGQWDYEPSYGTTIVTEWNLVCKRSAMVGLVQSVFSGGVLVGAILFTWLADRYGRKPVHLGTQWALSACGVICACLPDYTSFVALNFLRGAIREGVGLTGIVMMAELFPSGERTFAGTAFEIGWAVCWVLLAALGYLIRDWRYLMLTVSLASLFTVSYIWLLPESVVWLVANNKIDKAEKILHRAAKFNGVKLPQKILKRPSKGADIQGTGTPSAAEQSYQCTVADIFRSKIMITNTIIMFGIWFCDTMVYYALTLSTSLLAGNRFINFALSGLVELPAYVVPIYVLKRFGRRKPIFIFHVIAGLCLGISIYIPNETAGGADLRWLSTALVMLGKGGITASFASVVLYSPEVFPTNIRNFGFGMSSIGGRLGGMLSPFYSLLGFSMFAIMTASATCFDCPGVSNILKRAQEVAWLPGLLCAGLSLAAGALVLLLPETANKPLPNTIQEIESWSRQGRIFRKREAERRSEKDETTKKQIL